MTFLDAIQAIEKKAEKLGIRYKDGTPMPGVVAMGRIAKYFDARWDHVLDALEMGHLTVDEYFIEMMKMLEEYGHRGRE